MTSPDPYACGKPTGDGRPCVLHRGHRIACLPLGLPAAAISADGRYRYSLSRDVAPLAGDGRLLFVMLNPSTADATQDDATLRRCLGYGLRWGVAELAVGNLYALRSPKPVDLWLEDDPVGPENDDWLKRLAEWATRTVVAWGANPGPIPDRVDRVLDLLGDVEALALTDRGLPRHPLYLRRDLEPTSYRRRRRGA